MRKIVSSGAAQAAIWPAPSSEFFQSWFDFYPLFAAETGGKQLVEDGKATFDGAEGQAVADFWKTVYEKGCAPKETYNGDSFADGKAAMAIVGPWAIAVYDDKVDWGVVPVPTSAGTPAEEINTFCDAKNVAMYSACKTKGTAWDVLKFATCKEQDGALLDETGQMPHAHRPGQPPTRDYFGRTPTTRRSPSRPRAPSRCRTSRTPSRSGRPSATATRRRHLREAAVDAAACDGRREVDELAGQC